MSLSNDSVATSTLILKIFQRSSLKDPSFVEKYVFVPLSIIISDLSVGVGHQSFVVILFIVLVFFLQEDKSTLIIPASVFIWFVFYRCSIIFSPFFFKCFGLLSIARQPW